MISKAQEQLEATLNHDKQFIKMHRGFHRILNNHKVKKRNTYNKHKTHRTMSRLQIHKHHHTKLKTLFKSESSVMSPTHRNPTDSPPSSAHNSIPTFLPGQNLNPNLNNTYNSNTNVSVPLTRPVNKHTVIRNGIHKSFKNFPRQVKDIAWSRVGISLVLISMCILGINHASSSINHLAQAQKQQHATAMFNNHPVLHANVQATTQKKKNFIATMAHAARNQSKYKISPSLVIAQGILESGWGKSKLYQDDNNAFGVKGKYQGHYSYFNTQEDNGGNHYELAMFRKYPDLEDGIEDHNKLLYHNYLNGIPKNDYIADAKALQKNGYATDPNYAQEIMSVVQENHLSKYD